MRKRLTIDLDMAMIDEASIALGTTGVDETVHTALLEIVEARRRLRLLELEPNLTLQGLTADRRGDSPDPYP